MHLFILNENFIALLMLIFPYRVIYSPSENFMGNLCKYDLHNGMNICSIFLLVHLSEVNTDCLHYLLILSYVISHQTSPQGLGNINKWINVKRSEEKWTGTYFTCLCLKCIALFQMTLTISLVVRKRCFLLETETIQ